MWKKICRLKQLVVLAKMHAESILHYVPKKLWVFLLLLLSIDYYVLRMYLPSFTTVDDQMKIFPSLITFNSIIIAGIGIMYQVQATKNSEMEFKIHEQRTKFYEEFLKFFANFLVTQRENNSKFIGGKAWMRLHFKMAAYASPEFIKIYSSIKENPSQNLENFAKLFKQIRNEVGFTEKDVDVRKLLGLFLNDVQDPKYEEILEKIK